MKLDPLVLQLPPPFNYHRLISDSDHLHFGLWPHDGSELKIADARKNMFDKLIAYLPEPPARILDVGCGLGLSSHLLGLKGYAVTAIDAIPELIDYAIHRYGSNEADFRGLDYLDEDVSIFAEGGYDVLFFQDSLQFLHPLNEVMRKARRLLRDKGLLIIADPVCYDAKIESETSFHMSRDIYAALSENGFRITENEKMGSEVVRTCDWAVDRLTELFDELVSAVGDASAEDDLLSLLAKWKNQKAWYESGQCGHEIFVGKRDPFFIRSYVEGDEHEILALFNQVFKTNRRLDHWYWKFRDNPYGSHRICLGISGEGEIVSQYAGYPVPFCSTIEDDTTPEYFLTVHIGDTFTLPKVRRIGLGKTGLLARTTSYYVAKFLEGFVPFGFGFNTAAIKKLGERYLGYRFGDPVVLWRKEISEGKFERPRFYNRVFSGLRVEEVHSVNDEWDDFFARVCPAYEFLVKRDAAYLQWRYMDCPDKRYRIFVVRKRGTLVGWSVFAVRDTRLIWGDALFDSRFLESVSLLLRHVLAAYPRNVDGLEAWFSRNHKWWCDRLRLIGFDGVPEPDGLTLCYRTFWDPVWDDHSVTERLTGHFYYTWGDSDLF